MDAEGRLRRDKELYKCLLFYLKVIPALLALFCALNTILDFLGYTTEWMSFISGTSLLPIVFLYLASYAFRFCEYHRMFLHYVVANNALTYYDYYIGIPLSNRMMFAIQMFVLAVFLFLVLYYHQKEKCCK